MPKYKPLPSVETLRELFSYNKETGVLHWNNRRLGVNADLVAGAPSHGYVVVRIGGLLFLAHRVIWKLVTGEDPIDQIDHEDLNRSNNKWINLRPASNSKNMMNAGLSSANSSGIKGVNWDRGAWVVRIKVEKTTHYFGRHKRFEDAVTKMRIERDRLHGEFARAA